MKAFLKYFVVRILTWEAQMVLKKYRPYVIAITGSVGKTGTKNAIYAAIEHSVYARRATKGLNSDIGVPLSILGCETGWNSPLKWLNNMLEGLALILFKNHYPRFLVLEVGADHPGDIESIARWLKPDVTVITALPDVPAHIEFFRAPEDVIREKRKLIDYMKEDGVLVLNGDDPKVWALRNEYQQKIISYGTEAHTDITGSTVEFLYEDSVPKGMSYRMEGCGLIEDTQIAGALGKHQIYPHLAALAVAHALGVSCEMALRGLKEHVGPNGRMRIIPGVRGTVIIDDTYNSSPIAAREALNTLKKLKAKGRRIAVLGDMLELGRFSVEAHKKVGVQAAGIVDVLVTVGVRAQGIAEAARKAGMDSEKVIEFGTNQAQAAGKHLRILIEEGDIILAKGSQAIRLERVVKELMEEPTKAQSLLFRQEPEWLQRP